MGTFHWQHDALNAEEAEENLRMISPHVQLARKADLRHRLRMDGDERFSTLRLEVFGEMFGINQPDDTITISYPVSGLMEWRVGEERGRANLPWLQGTSEETFSRFGPVVILTTFLPKDPLLSFGRAFFGDDEFGLDFDGVTAISEPHARSLGAVLEHARDLASADLFEHELVRATLYRYLAVSVFEGLRLRGDRRERALTVEARQRRYRIAAAFLDEHASLPITVADAASAAGVCVSELERIFLGHSPSNITAQAHLERARLSAAHADLVAGDPTLGDTLREIAHRWGVASPSRFARLYRAQYGANPKWPLDR